MSWADLTTRDAWQKVEVAGTASDSHIYVVLRMHGAPGAHVFSSCWKIDEGALL